MIDPITSLDSPAQVKGFMVRSIVTVLLRHGLRDQVVARVGPRAAALIEDPPLATEWLDVVPHNEILQALFELLGSEKLRALNREAVELGVSPLVKGAAMSVLRVFGTSPATLLARFDRVSGTTARGILYRWTPAGENGGSLEIAYPGLQNVPLGPLVATAGALSIIFELCGVREGTIGDPEWVSSTVRNRARYPVSWR